MAAKRKLLLSSFKQMRYSTVTYKKVCFQSISFFSVFFREKTKFFPFFFFSIINSLPFFKFYGTFYLQKMVPIGTVFHCLINLNQVMEFSLPLRKNAIQEYAFSTLALLKQTSLILLQVAQDENVHFQTYFISILKESKNKSTLM